MKCSIQILTILVLISNTSCVSFKKTPRNENDPKEKWTFKDTELYSKRNLDSSKWSLKKLSSDLKNSQIKYDVKLPISDYPSPVADYSGNGSSTIPLSIQLNNKTIQGYTVAHYKDKYNAHLFKDSVGQYYTFFTILYLTDLPNLDKGENPKISSRNYPHYLFTGTQNTTFGNIDWVQMTLASGENFAIVTQRYFDLKAGRTILVAPLMDGTIRFLQLQVSPETFTWDELSKQSVATLKKFTSEIISDQSVVDFFNQKNTIGKQ